MKILFIHPHGSNWMPGSNDITTIFNIMPPLGMMNVAAWLERCGIDVEIIDCYATPLTQEELVGEVIQIGRASCRERV